MVTCSLLVLLIVSLFAVSNSPSVSAQAPRTVLFSAASESNLDVLFEKTMNAPTTATTGAEPAFQPFETDGQNVSQLIEVRQYQDGTIEKDYVETSFSALVSEGAVVSLTADSFLDEKQVGGYDVVAVTQASYTAEPVGAKIKYTYHYLRGKLTQKSGTKNVKIVLTATYQESLDKQECQIPFTVTTNSSAGIWYTKSFETSGMIISVSFSTGGAGAFGEFIVTGATGGGTLLSEITFYKV